jgi:hypothetical protein
MESNQRKVSVSHQVRRAVINYANFPLCRNQWVKQILIASVHRTCKKYTSSMSGGIYYIHNIFHRFFERFRSQLSNKGFINSNVQIQLIKSLQYLKENEFIFLK